MGWQPKTGQVSYEEKDKDGKPVKVTYVQSQLNGAPANVKDEIDPAFYNDQYNLLGRRRRTRYGHAKIAPGQGFGEASRGEIFF